MKNQNISRTDEEFNAVKEENTNGQKVLKFLFSLKVPVSAAEIAPNVGMDIKTTQASINYTKLHEHAEIETTRNGRTCSYLLVKINPENIKNPVRYEYTSESGITFYGIPHIARHLKVNKESLHYQVRTMGKSIDEAIAYLKTIGAINRKEENGLVFVKKAMNCPKPSWMGSLTPGV